MSATPEDATVELDILAEESLLIRASVDAVWATVADLSKRPTLKSWTPLAGDWPKETARARTIMDKGAADMVRIETVVNCLAGRRLLVKITPLDHAMTAWLDHRIAREADATRLTMSVIVSMALPAAAVAAVNRSDYAQGSAAALRATLQGYRAQLEPPHV